MKMVKSLLLGTAAGLVAIAGAQAADLPVKAKPVQYVKICSLYGVGFYYIPGTDTCIKVGGFVRAEYYINSNFGFKPYTSADFDSRSHDWYHNRSRGMLTLDARTGTEYGTLRSYIAMAMQAHDAGRGITYNPRAFIQWAGFTFGLASSFFDFYVNPHFSNTTNILGSDTGGGGDPVWAYTAQFGGGLSGTLSVEDGRTRRTIIGGIQAYGGNRMPDLVANLRLDQAWGSAQVMGAAHQVYGNIYGEDIGWAAGVGLKANLPWGKGDALEVQFTYTKGALKYVGSGLGTFSIWSGSTNAFGPVADAIGYINAAGGQSMDLTEAWSVIAGVHHNWGNNLTSSLWGSYADFNYSDAVSAWLYGAGADADWQYYQIGSRTIWKAAPTLAFSLEIVYNNVNGANRLLPQDGNVDWFQGDIRVQRNFYP